MRRGRGARHCDRRGAGCPAGTRVSLQAGRRCAVLAQRVALFCTFCNSRRLALPADVSYKLGVHLEQDPLLYTEGSEFLMPGPLGNLYQVPMNLKVRMLLQLQARKAFEIYRSVNFPRPPADFMVRASAPGAANPHSRRAHRRTPGARSECGVPPCAQSGGRRGRRR